MAISGDVGSVATLWRFPVKSMAGEQLQDAQVTERGVLGDRAYALIDKDTRSGSIRSNCSAGPRSRISAVQTRNAAATAPGLRAQARPPGTEFLDAETGRQKSSTNARTPTETKIQELSTRKSAQKRPIWRRVGNAWFARTGWWCAQSCANWSLAR